MKTDYQPNSHRSKESGRTTKNNEKKRAEKVVKGKVRTKKKSELQKLKSNIISEEAADLKSYIFSDILIPSIKDVIEDTVINSVRMLLRGETNTRRAGSSGVSRISYNKISDSRSRERSYSTSRARVGYSFDDVVLETRGEAEEVIDNLEEMLDMYGIVSIADMYDLVGIEPRNTDFKYGWTNIRNAEPVRVSDGYLLKMPRVMPID